MEDSKPKNKIFIFFIITIIIFSFFYFLSLNRRKDLIIHISSGQTVNSIVEELKMNEIIKNDLAFKFFLKLFSDSEIVSGDYSIKKNSSILTIAWQLAKGHHNIKQVKITFPEGITNQEMSNLLAQKLSDFDENSFLKAVDQSQGYLFPDTYFFFPLETEDEIIKKLSSNFENKIKNIKSLIESNNKKLSEIIVMASILEGEAGGVNDIGIISGILWKRISLNMPLQVDVDKSTYNKKGLPSKPLNNPGLLAIKSATNPTKSEYLYYLHDKNGQIHYAKTFDEHKNNINKYLK